MPSVMRTILLPLSWLYGLAAAARNAAFDRGLIRGRRAAVPVISVGNLTAGGTGKTPLVEHITGILGANGLHVAIVSRGYGRRTRGVVVVSCRGEIRADAFSGGDEPVQIARKFPSASVVVGERRIDAAEKAVRECGARVIVLDDAFQHRFIERDLNILVIDAEKEFPRERLLPSGMRREWFSGLRRADLIGFSRAASGGDPSWAGDLGRFTEAGTFAYRTVLTGFAKIPGDEPVESASLRGKRVMAFSGIGNHAGFIASLRGEGIVVIAEKRFRDHHVYTAGDFEDILASAAGAEACMTTEKDMVRIIADPVLVSKVRTGAPFLYAVAKAGILRGGEVLERAVMHAAADRRSA